MWNHRSVRCLLYPVCLLALASGCEALHGYRPVAVLVRDAETKKPIAATEVRISYPCATGTFVPQDSTGTTGDDGIARLRAAPYGELALRLDGTAKGYLSDGINLPLEGIKAIETAHWGEKVEQRPVNFVLELYAEPGPTVELVVPVGYHGLVKADVLVGEDAPCPSGQRCFSSAVPPSGVVQVALPSWCRRFGQPDFVLKSADGALLGNQPRPTEVGSWWLKRDGTTHVFLIGTQWELDAYRREAAREAGESLFSVGGKSGSRHHRRGEQSPANAGPAGTMP
jgi:hypothetical protein